MIDSLRVASGLMKRAAEGGDVQYDLPPWAMAIVALSILVFLPGIFFVGRTPFPAVARLTRVDWPGRSATP